VAGAVGIGREEATRTVHQEPSWDDLLGSDDG